jgi:hypothetical protein
MSSKLPWKKFSLKNFFVSIDTVTYGKKIKESKISCPLPLQQAVAYFEALEKANDLFAGVGVEFKSSLVPPFDIYNRTYKAMGFFNLITGKIVSIVPAKNTTQQKMLDAPPVTGMIIFTMDAKYEYQNPKVHLSKSAIANQNVWDKSIINTADIKSEIIKFVVRETGCDVAPIVRILNSVPDVSATDDLTCSL